MKLVHKATGAPVEIGDLVIDFRGDRAEVTSFERPHKPASAGFMSVKDSDGCTGRYYPSVFGCEWIEREDRADWSDDDNLGAA